MQSQKKKKRAKPNRRLKWRKLKSFRQGDLFVEVYSSKIAEKVKIYQFDFSTPSDGELKNEIYKAKDLQTAKKLFRKDYG